jgi:endogenous inhibitor of DNA gyrase (YacG/DUF329 family)
MKCPHCEAKVSIFSKAMNRAGKTKNCPHCGKPVKVSLNRSNFIGVFFVVAIGGTLLGIGGTISMGVAALLAALAGVGLKMAES